MRIKDYIIEETISKGKNFIICRAQNINNNTSCILKILEKKISRKAAVEKALKQEYMLLNLFDSDYIIKPQGWFENEEYAGIEMEDIQGLSLKTHLDKKPIQLPVFMNLAVLIIKGLLEIHRQNVIHKDINPANIIWNNNTGSIKIIDFDIASKFSVKMSYVGNPKKLKGSLPYISPEQSGRMNANVDQRTDFYSLGATFYELITGRPPFTHKNPIEVIHSHLARIPAPPSSINKGIPEIISKIIMKLLAKSPEERYQSSEGLLFDLKKAIKTDFSDFTLGAKDYSNILHIPEKLYGRKKEIHRLLEAYERIGTGSKETLMVAGYSGTGKTSLVNEIHKPITRDSGYFITGKFDQLQRGIPYSAFTQALNQFCGILLSENENTLLIWKKRILKAIGNLGKLLTDIVPELEAVLGKQPSLPEVDPGEEEKRLNYVFQSFFKAIATEEHPLVIFIDDMQWADIVSLNLLTILMEDKDLRYFLFIGAYRDNEVSPMHPLTHCMEELSKSSTLNTIPVVNLTEKNINELLNDTLGFKGTESNNQSNILAKLIFEKTLGNAFFTVRFLQNLYEENLLIFDPSQRGWQWNIREIEKQNISTNVIELLIKKINTFKTGTNEALMLAACIGNTFELTTLSIISNREKDELSKNLETALSEKLIYQLEDEVYKFVHDRIQQASYLLIPEEDKKQLHLKIGKLLLQSFENNPDHSKAGETEQYIFTIVNHLNLGIDLIDTDDERMKLLELNLKTVKNARESAAFKLAGDHMEIALSLLPDNENEYYELILDVYNEAVRIYYSLGDYEKMEGITKKITRFSKTIDDSALANEYVMKSYLASNQSYKALDTILEYFKSVDIHIPRHPTEEENTAIMNKTINLLEKNGIDFIKNLPLMEDKKFKTLMRLNSIGGTVVFFAAPELLIYYYCTIFLMICQKGLTAESPYFIALYAMMRARNINDNDTAFQLGECVEYLLNKGVGTVGSKVKADTMVGLYTYALKYHFKSLVSFFNKTYLAAINVGDFEFAGYLMANNALCMSVTDMELPVLSDKLRTFINTSVQLKQIFFLDMINLYIAFNDVLQDKTAQRTELEIEKGQLFQEEAGATNALNAWIFYDRHIILAILFEKYECLAEYIEKAKIYSSQVGAPNPYLISISLFYHCLAYLQLAEGAKNREQKDLHIKNAVENIESLKKLSELGKENYLHKYLLLKAELSRITGENKNAEELYDQSIELAIQHEFSHEAALAAELSAKYYMKKNNKLASLYLTEARNLYNKWGAKAKVKHLEDNYPKYLDVHFPGSFSFTKTITGSYTTGDILDIKSILQASNILAGEVHLKGLLEKMLSILLENAGAERCLLIENVNDNLLIQAEGTTDGVTDILQAYPVNDSGRIPVSVINYVSRSKKELVFEDLSKNTDYESDKYVQKKQPKSTACFPITSKGQLIAIIYLENNLIEGAFNQKRLELINMLSAQIAVSLENTRLYENMETKVKERTRELQKTQNQLIESEKLAALGQLTAGVSHEINTPLGAIRSSARHLDSILTDVLPEFPGFIKELPDELLDLFTRLLNIGVKKERLSAREERSRKKGIKAALSKLGIEPDGQVVSRLLAIGLHNDLDDFLPLLQSSMRNSVLQKAYDLSSIIQNTKIIQSASEKAAKVSFALKSYSHFDHKGEKSEATIKDTLETVLTLYNNQIRQGIEVVRDYEEIPPVRCFPDELNQVWTNLIHNAIQAMDNKGTLTIQISRSGGFVSVSIKDSGEGITEEIKNKMFNPFYTTRPLGEGSGLGLSIVKKIIDKHNGQIKVESTPGEGTIFTVFLPEQA